MLWYYRFAGLVAVIALVLNMLMLVAVMILIKAAFTLTGLAGLALTVGMAVDNNVLVYERLREELAPRGRPADGDPQRLPPRRRGRSSTPTSPTSSPPRCSTCVGTEQIKGFAITFWLGVVIEHVDLDVRRPRDLRHRRAAAAGSRKLKMLHVDRPHEHRLHGLVPRLRDVLGADYGAGRWWSPFYRGKGLFDIDFTGGVSVQTVFREPQRHRARSCAGPGPQAGGPGRQRRQPERANWRAPSSSSTPRSKTRRRFATH